MSKSKNKTKRGRPAVGHPLYRQVQLQIPVELHRKRKIEAELKGKPLKTYLLHLIEVA